MAGIVAPPPGTKYDGNPHDGRPVRAGRLTIRMIRSAR